MLKKILCAVLLIATVITVTACEKPKSFTYADITLTFDKDFREEKSDDYDMLLTNGEVTAALTRLSFVDALNQNISAAMREEEFAKYLLLKSGKDMEVLRRGDYAYYTYREKTSSGELYCMATFYRTAYAYVVVLYATSVTLETKYSEKFFEYADSAVMSLEA